MTAIRTEFTKQLRAAGLRGKGLWQAALGVGKQGNQKVGQKAESHGRQRRPLGRGAQKSGELAAMVKAMLCRRLALETKSLGMPPRSLALKVGPQSLEN